MDWVLRIWLRHCLMGAKAADCWAAVECMFAEASASLPHIRPPATISRTIYISVTNWQSIKYCMEHTLLHPSRPRPAAARPEEVHCIFTLWSVLCWEGWPLMRRSALWSCPACQWGSPEGGTAWRGCLMGPPLPNHSQRLHTCRPAQSGVEAIVASSRGTSYPAAGYRCSPCTAADRQGQHSFSMKEEASYLAAVEVQDAQQRPARNQQRH